MRNKRDAGRWLGGQPAGGGQDTQRCTSAHQHSTAIFAAGKIVGFVKDGVFHKSVRASRHMLRRPLAWALDLQSLKDAEAAGARRVALHDRESGRVYEAAISLIRQRGFVFNRGHGQQIGLPLAHWHVVRAGVRQLTLFEVAA